jgi:aminoglycoside phosphotransferase (APT) family kinase protein
MSGPERRYLGAIIPVKAAHRFDAARLEGYLAANLSGFRGPLDAAQFEGGQSNPTYRISSPGQRYVLRRKPPGVTLASAHAVDREYRVLKALHGQGFPVPEPLLYEEDAAVIGSPFYVMEMIEGRVFLDCRMPDLSREERGAVFDSANETLAQLHALDPATIGLEDYGRPGDYFQRQVARWSKQYRASQTRSIPAMDSLIDWLPGALPTASVDIPRIVHGDYSFHNLLIHPTEPRVVAVIDWELSTTGDPLGDIMYHAMEWYRPAGVDERGTLKDGDPEALGIPGLDAYLARYFERRNMAVPTNLGFYRAFNLFRVAAILQGIVARERAGNAAAADAAGMAAKIEPLAEAAWAEAQTTSL